MFVTLKIIFFDKILFEGTKEECDIFKKNFVKTLSKLDDELRDTYAMKTKEIDISIENIISKSNDDLGTSYYYRGDVKNKQNKAALTNMIFFMIFYFQQKAPGIIPT